MVLGENPGAGVPGAETRKGREETECEVGRDSPRSNTLTDRDLETSAVWSGEERSGGLGRPD